MRTQHSTWAYQPEQRNVLLATQTLPTLLANQVLVQNQAIGINCGLEIHPS
ncbi:hypothetical protein JCM19238_3619 [Vibrio ponticus]|nr:hypothetical protein JCM19238_3619 [Vibrio ponticus]